MFPYIQSYVWLLRANICDTETDMFHTKKHSSSNISGHFDKSVECKKPLKQSAAPYFPINLNFSSEKNLLVPALIFLNFDIRTFQFLDFK